ncbi:LYPD1 protein, partial [Polypterus senegalus]
MQEVQDKKIKGHFSPGIMVKQVLYCIASQGEDSEGVIYRKSCASSAACLIASSGYQSFCSPGKIGSVCISCCNTHLCNGPRPRKRGNSAAAPLSHSHAGGFLLPLLLAILLT